MVQLQASSEVLPLRVASMSCSSLEGRLHGVVHVAVASNPDVLGLQELWDS